MTNPKKMINNAAIAAGCRACCWMSQCGGLEPPSAQGCFLDWFCKCNPATCQFVCPRKPDFYKHYGQVGGFESLALPMLTVPTDNLLGNYVPKIGTGSRRTGFLQESIVAVSLYRILGFKNGRYGLCIGSIAELRERYRLSAETRIIAVANEFDRYLESLWKNHEILDLLPTLGRFGLWGVMVPNFSFFLEAPRTHSLFNRKRAELIMKAFTEYKIPTIPHIQASVDFPSDWQYWAKFLQAHPEVKTVSAEFGTGWMDKAMAARAINRLGELRQAVGRPIRLLAISGAQFFPELRSVWPECTVVDFNPFVKTMKRQKLHVDNVWVSVHTTQGAPVDDLLAENICQYRYALGLRQPASEKIDATLPDDNAPVPSDPRQMILLDENGGTDFPSGRVRTISHPSIGNGFLPTGTSKPLTGIYVENELVAAGNPVGIT